MDLGFVGLGRMGLNMTIRLARAGLRVVAWNRTADKVAEAKSHGAEGAASLEALAAALKPPRAIWAMTPSPGSPSRPKCFIRVSNVQSSPLWLNSAPDMS